MNNIFENRYIRSILALAGLMCCVAANQLTARVAERPQFVNLSARAQVGTGQDVLVGGFVLEGNSPKQMLIRVAGPALAPFGVSPVLTATKITLYSGTREVANNSGGTSANSAEIQVAMGKLGAFPFPANGLNACLLVSLDPGAYSVVVSSADGNRGIALLEVYQLPAGSSSVLTPENQAKIQQLVDKALRDYDIPGILYSVKFVGEQAWSQGRGVRDLATKASLQADDYIRIGSASKTFTGMAIFKAIEDKRLKLDTTIDKLLPAAVLSNYPKSRITVRMLLNHTSAIVSYTDFLAAWFMPYINNRTRVWSDLELIQMVNSKFSDAELGPWETPGVVWNYSNTNTLLLGQILEQIYKKPIRDLIQEWFITPLGLTKTIYPAPGQSVMPEPFAHGYMNWANYVDQPSLPSTDRDVSQYDPSGVGGAGAIISTVGDLAKWMESIAQQDDGSATYRRGHLDWKFFTGFGSTLNTASAPQNSYSGHMAHEADSTNNADYWIVGHRGQLSGYDTAMMYLPDYDCAIVVACTRSLKNAPGFPTNAAAVALNGMVNILYPKLITDNKTAPVKTEIVKSEGSEDSVNAESPNRTRVMSQRKKLNLPLSEY